MKAAILFMITALVQSDRHLAEHSCRTIKNGDDVEYGFGAAGRHISEILQPHAFMGIPGLPKLKLPHCSRKMAEVF